MLLAEQITPYEKVENWLIAYADWKARLEYAQTELTHVPGLTKALHEVAIFGRGQPNDTLLRTVINRLEITEYEIPFLQSRIGLIEYAFSTLAAEEKRFVQLRYQDQLTYSIVMDRLGLSRRAYFYHRKRILKKIYYKIKSRTALLEYDPFGEK